jgi:hypothetical protein
MYLAIFDLFAELFIGQNQFHLTRPTGILG